jgi:hypothetical protein
MIAYCSGPFNMKKIITSAAILLMLFGLISLPQNKEGFHTGKPAFAICTADDIKNTCCAKFFRILEGDVMVDKPQTREMKALAGFRQCLRKDVGCSVEMTELKSNGISQIRQICK